MNTNENKAENLSVFFYGNPLIFDMEIGKITFIHIPFDFDITSIFTHSFNKDLLFLGCELKTRMSKINLKYT